MFQDIKLYIESLNFNEISNIRREKLDQLIQIIEQNYNTKGIVILNFICTHNSRRSQFSQIWASVASTYYDLNIKNYSGGIEVTACHKNTISSLKRAGLEIETNSKNPKKNPIYEAYYSSKQTPVKLYSKTYDASENPSKNFIAIMTCDDADENCPIINGCEHRFSLTYKDPKVYDDTNQTEKQYDYCSIKIATEIFYIFSKIKK